MPYATKQPPVPPKGKWSRLGWFALGASLMPAILLARKPGINLDDIPPFESARWGGLRHSGNYPAMTVSWSVSNIKDVNAVFPHPVIPARAVAATGNGLILTEDSGQNWQILPHASTDILGNVTDIAFSHAQQDTFYIATKSKGLWITTDNGKTLRQIGSRENGLASDSINSIEYYAHDPNGQTLLVSHGDAAPGVSRSVDGGKNWTVLFPDYNVQRIYTSSWQGIFIVAAPKSDPDSTRLYLTPSLSEAWQEMLRDFLCTGLTRPLLNDSWLLVATADRGILRIARNGGVVRNVAPAGISQWSSIGVTWGANADSQLIYAFEPTKLGMVLLDMPSSDTTDEATDAPPPTKYTTASEGLLTSSIVREGAHIRANASGTTFYACINSLLYCGQRQQGPLNITDLTISPPIRHYDPESEGDAINTISSQIHSFLDSSDINRAAPALLQVLKQQDSALRDRCMTLTAKVASTDVKPRQLTVDLSRFNLSPRTVLQPAGDGLYTSTFFLDLVHSQRRNEDWRRHWPGIVGLSVTAAGDSDALSGAVAPVSIVVTTPGFPFFDGHYYPEQGKISTMMGAGAFLRNGHYTKGFAIEQPGPWRLVLNHGWGGETFDLSSFYAFSFWIRCREESTDELFVQLRDQKLYGYPATTPPVPLLKNHLVPGDKFNGKFQRIIIPISLLLDKAEGFEPTIWKSLILSGQTNKRVEFYIDNPRLYPSADSLLTEEGAR